MFEPLESVYPLLKSQGYDVNDPWDVVDIFEKKLADFAGSKYAISVDNCTDGMFLCLKYLNYKGEITIPKHTWLSVPGMIIHAGCKVKFEDLEWSGVYQLKPTPVYDGATRFTEGMYIKDSYQCVSFHHRKPLKIGKGGMIFTDDEDAYKWLKIARYEGRDISVPYPEDKHDILGWNMYMPPEQAARGILLFEDLPKQNKDTGNNNSYKDLSGYEIFNKKIELEEIVNIHSGIPAVVCGHGPSLNDHKEKIIELQKKQELIRFSVNNWYDYFVDAPSYWVLSNPEFSIPKMHSVMNKFMVPILYSLDGDFTPYDKIEEMLSCNYLPYDQRHFKNHDCIQILQSFKSHHEKNKNFDFTEYGNNPIMWHPPRIGGREGWAGFDLYGRCCKHKRCSITIQEKLQEISGCDKHYSTGDTVALHALSFALLMGCNPIYVSGMDLDYSRGYADKTKPVPMGHYTMWQDNSKNLLNDMEIINTSANLLGTKIINLYKDSWYDKFTIGDLEL